jgi:23S rRNA (uracil1939-C5)-methyltransferase
MARRKKLSPDPFETRILKLLENGRGDCLHKDRPLQVHGALPGETVMARYLFGRRMRGQAETLEVLEPSADRIEPRCPHFGTCSACSLQHLDPHAQLAFKQETMLGHLREEGEVSPLKILPPLSAGLWNYRRKARLSVRYVKAKDRVLVGFRERDGRFVADMSECHVLTKAVADRLADLAALIASMDAAQTIAQIEVTSGDKHSALIFRHLEPLSDADTGALKSFARESGLAVLLQPKGPDTVNALEPEQPGLCYALGEYDVDYQFEPLDFIQVNGELNALMVRQALDLLQLRKQDNVLDLFCGLGNFTLPLARSCKQVTGVEGDEGLVERAIFNAQRNGLGNARFIRTDLYASTPVEQAIAGQYQKILLDPPRSGAEQVLPLIAASGASKVVYVSCNPKTLGSDAGKLVHQHGFRLMAAGVMDMFPHTSHIESMALFERNNEETTGT